MKIFLLYFFVIIFFIIFQTGFISAGPSFLNMINLVLSMLIFIGIFLGYNLSLWWAFITGLIWDISSINGFGTITFSLLLTAIIINLLFNNLFTNYSLYSLLILGAIGTAVFEAIFYSIRYVNQLFGLVDLAVSFNKYMLYDFFLQILFNVMFLTLLYVFVGRKLIREHQV